MEFRELSAQPTVGIRASCAMAEIPAVLSDILPAVWKWCEERGVQPVSAPFVRYYSMENGRLDLEGGLFVAEPPQVDGRIVAGELPGGPAGYHLHVGPYHEIYKSAMALDAWVVEQGRTSGADYWEVYIDDPAEVPEAELRTELYRSV